MVLNMYALKKKKVVRGNHKPHLNKELRKAIMLRSRLKNKAKETESDVDIAAYTFWKTCKPYFSINYSRRDTSSSRNFHIIAN